MKIGELVERLESAYETLSKCESAINELRAERDALKEQNAALAAQVEVFKKIREDWKGLAINDAKTLIEFIEAADKAPQHHLAEIRAEAGRAGFIAGADDTYRYLIGIPSAPKELTSGRANKYADSIRQGEVK